MQKRHEVLKRLVTRSLRKTSSAITSSARLPVCLQIELPSQNLWILGKSFSVDRCVSHGRLEERSGGIYRASAGTVYPTLQQLEDEGLIISELQDSKKVYKLTDAGRRELADRDETVQQIWRRARRWEDWRAAFDPDAAEICGPAERLVKAAFRAAAGEQAAHRIERVREILLRTLRELQKFARSASR